MLGALFRMFFRGVLFLFLAIAAFGVYHLYQTGRLPFVRRAVEEATLAGSVRAAFAVDRLLAHRAVDVAVREGVVVLEGTVASPEERVAAEELAASIEGVESVDNRIEIDESVPPRDPSRSLGEKLDDVTLLAKVRTALHLDRNTRELDVDVDVRSGVVTLSGEVPSSEVAEKLRARVSRVDGVDSLEDKLVVTLERP